MTMTRRERFEALLGGRPADRVPRALWHHFPHADYRTDPFVEATLAFHRRHDMDLLKICPRSSFCVRDYGGEDVFDGDVLGRTHYLKQVIDAPADWRALRPLDPASGWLGHTAECIRRVAAGADAATPVISTIFSPATQAKNLAGLDRFLEHWRARPDDVRAGLETLAETTIRFVQSLDGVLDGMFFTIQECGIPGLHPTYHEMCADLDRAILAALPAWLHVLHLHGGIVDYAAFAAYPVSIVHWDVVVSGISLDQGRALGSPLVSGGLAWPDGGWPDAESVRDEARRIVNVAGPDRLLLSAGCVIPHATPPSHIDAFSRFDE